ncbi:transmembrane adaptor Erv26 [Limtongia smithiae]|uniref:transmembrane adaptor Erv26 n=1 Tax=Limtongia smithiae TaxID=1125753 RepID=UPI0034CD3CE8
MILALLSYCGIIIGFVFLTLAIAAGLYYLSELVEEHSRFTQRLLEKLIYGIIGVHVLLLLFDHFPFWLTVFSIATQVVYYQNLKQFPFIQLSSGTFIASCVIVLLNHYFWFQHFSRPSVPPPTLRSSPLYEPPSVLPTFSEISSFFGICVWLVPFSLFVSLSAADNVLPSTTDLSASSGGLGSGSLGGSAGALTSSSSGGGLGSLGGFGGSEGSAAKAGAATLRRGQGMAKVLIGKCREGIAEVARVVGWGDDSRTGSARLV